MQARRKSYNNLQFSTFNNICPASDCTFSGTDTIHIYGKIGEDTKFNVSGSCQLILHGETGHHAEFEISENAIVCFKKAPPPTVILHAEHPDMVILPSVEMPVARSANSFFAPSAPPIDSFSADDSQYDDSDEPEELLCPTNHTIMKTPTFCTLDEATYEYDAIKQWLDKNATSPLTRARLKPGQQSDDVLFRNRNLERSIRRHFTNQKDATTISFVNKQCDFAHDASREDASQSKGAN